MSAPVLSKLVQRPVLPPEPPPGSVITWQAQFEPGGQTYTYAAVHVAVRGWYVSNESETPYWWPELVYWLIGTAPIYIAAAWGAL